MRHNNVLKMKYVYEFTNQRKLTKAEFLKWFQKKALYIIRKFKMVNSEDVIVYENKGDFRGAVLEDILKMYAEKGNVELIKFPSSIPPTTLPKKLLPNNFKSQSKQSKIKLAISSTTDTVSRKFILELIKGNTKNLKKLSPVSSKIIKPLYLFLDKEVLLYAKLKNLKFKKTKDKEDKISKFISNLEVKHLEIKQAIISSYLELF